LLSQAGDYATFKFQPHLLRHPPREARTLSLTIEAQASQESASEAENVGNARAAGEKRCKGDIIVCPECGGTMRRIGHFSPMKPKPFRCDTS